MEKAKSPVGSADNGVEADGGPQCFPQSPRGANELDKEGCGQAHREIMPHSGKGPMPINPIPKM